MSQILRFYHKPFQRLLSLSLVLILLLTFSGCQQNTTSPAAPTPGPTAAPDSLLYQDASHPVEERVEDLLGRMTLEEKIGQMTLIEKNSIEPKDVAEHYIGAVLSGGGGYPLRNTAKGWADMVDEFQEYALQTRLGIPILYGVDAVHGHNNVEGAVIFPHNIGMGATRDADLLRRVGEVTAVEMAATGIHWNYAPCVTVPQDIRWGRTYEGYSEDTELVSLLGSAYLQGLQGDDLANPLTALATPKHFVGDGGTTWGSSTSGYQIDQGVSEVDEATLRAIHLPPYVEAIKSGAMSIMVSFSSWGGMKMHAQKYMISDVLKGELGFEGFVVSDWAGIDQISSNYYEAVVTSINAGVDMNMVPYNDDLFIRTLTSAVEKGDVPTERIDDAVRRILRVKFELGLFEHPFSDPALLEQVGSEAHRELAQETVSKSLVLLKNDHNALPIVKDTSLIFVAGEAADNIGIQCGGWTIEWQGQAGKITEGTTILEAIKETVSPDAQVEYNRFAKFDHVEDANGNPATAKVGIVVVGESPYAEGLGDNNDLSLSEPEIATIDRLRERCDKLVIILLSGRPIIITEQLALADAFVAAWLPGTEGQGVADVLFGDVPFTGKLSYTWPRTMDQIPFDFDNLPEQGCAAPLFPIGYGLDTAHSEPLELPDCP